MVPVRYLKAKYPAAMTARGSSVFRVMRAVVARTGRMEERDRCCWPSAEGTDAVEVDDACGASLCGDPLGDSLRFVISALVIDVISRS